MLQNFMGLEFKKGGSLRSGCKFLSRDPGRLGRVPIQNSGIQ